MSLYVKIKKPWVGEPITFPILSITDIEEYKVEIDISIKELNNLGIDENELMLKMHSRGLTKWYCLIHDILRIHVQTDEFHFICGIKDQIEKHQF